MKETGIIMSGDHPQKILDELKTKTRRVIVPQPKPCMHKETFTEKEVGYNAPPMWKGQIIDWIGYKYEGHEEWFCHICGNGLKHIDEFSAHGIICPYGQVGDRLWVRETYILESTEEYGYAAPNFVVPTDRPTKYIPWSDKGEYGDYYLIPHYRATEPEPNIVRDYQDNYDDKTKWSPSMFMPRWASRITLEITEVRLERVQEITEEDALLEGIKIAEGTWQAVARNKDSHKLEPIGEPQPYTARYHFEALWDSLNAKRGYGWEVNPWVWVIRFKLTVQPQV